MTWIFLANLVVVLVLGTPAVFLYLETRYRKRAAAWSGPARHPQRVEGHPADGKR